MVRSLRFIFFLLFFLYGGFVHGEEGVLRGYTHPDLLVVKFFSGIRGADYELLEGLWKDGGGIRYEGIGGDEYVGLDLVMDYFREWLSRERVEIGVWVTELDVGKEGASVGGGGEGEVLDLRTGLSRTVFVKFEGRLEVCGEGMWCLKTLSISEALDGGE